MLPCIVLLAVFYQRDVRGSPDSTASGSSPSDHQAIPTKEMKIP
jgi:hypothetical protein